MPKKSHLTIFAIRNLCKTRKNTREFHLSSWDHVCKINEWCLADCFHRELRVSIQIMICDYCIAKCNKNFRLRRAFNGPWCLFLITLNIHFPAADYH